MCVALVAVPAEVHEPRPAALQVVDLLPRVLADVADVEVARRAVEREPPRVAQAVGDELPTRLRRLRVQPHDLRERPREVLAVVLRVAAAAAVAVSPVEKTVGPELQLAAVVVRREVLDEEQLLGRAGNRRRPVRAVLDDARVAVSVGVVDVEAVCRRVVRRERDREETLLAAAHDEGADVEERRRPDLPALEHEDPPRLLDDVEPPRLARRRRCVHRRREVGNAYDAQRVAAGGCGAGRENRGGDERECEEPSQCAVRSGVFTHGPGSASRDSACRYARPASGRSLQRSKQKYRRRQCGKNLRLKL